MVVAVAADSLADTAELAKTLPAITLVTDPKLALSTAWGVVVPGADGPTPATYIVGADGVIRWRRLADSHGDWPTYAEVAAAL